MNDHPPAPAPHTAMPADNNALQVGRHALGEGLWELCPFGAAFEPESATLVVADLHLEKSTGLSLRGRGALPPYDSRATLNRLSALIAWRQPRAVVALGDSFHDVSAWWRLNERDRAFLVEVCSSRDWVWILGNHDPAPPRDLPGDSAHTVQVAGVSLRHEPDPHRAPGLCEMVGHLHPCARVRVRGKALRRPCFIGDGSRLMLPAFGAYTGSLNVLHPAFADVFSEPAIWAVGREKVVRLHPAQLIPD